MKNRKALIILLLATITVVAFWPALNFGFIDHYDDDQYITGNYWVRKGLSGESISWAFSSIGYSGNWHPLTWLSHMLDVELFGLNPRGHHAVNLTLHLANVILLFLLLHGLTDDAGKSAFAAALFAVHPLHVESVAWIAERKDVLSTLFWLLTMVTYLWYTRKASVERYLLMSTFFISGLMAKPMLVTLPFALLLLDFWPLKRWTWYGHGAKDFSKIISSLLSSRVFLEKLPLILIAAASGVVTFVAQSKAGAVIQLRGLSFMGRVGNALVSYVAYLGKMTIPTELSFYYPLPIVGWPLGKVGTAAAVFVVISAMVIRSGRGAPYMLTGWLWYVGTLVPVIGLVQTGSQAMADRYTYIPSIGLFVMITWAIPHFFGGRRIPKWTFIVPTGILFILMLITFRQVHYWRDSVSLFSHAVQIDPDNWFAHNDLGLALEYRREVDKAIYHYRQALRIDPSLPEVYNNLGNAFIKKGKYQEAVQAFRRALGIRPNFALAANNMGVALYSAGIPRESLEYLFEAVRIDPDYADAHVNLGAVLEKFGRLDEAEHHYREALRIQPDNVAAQGNLSRLLHR